MVKSVLGFRAAWFIALGLSGSLLISCSARNPPSGTAELVPVLTVRGIERYRDFYINSVSKASAADAGFLRSQYEGAQTAPIAIVPHHLLASSLITGALEGLDRRGIKLIILVSPDHFGQTPQGLGGFGSTQSWNTPFGIQKGIADPNLRERLIRQFPEIDFSDSEAYQIEHGIYGLVPYLAYYYKNVELLALSLVPSANFDFVRFAVRLREFFEAQGLPPSQIQIIISTDFVHHGTPGTTRDQDDQNLALLQNLTPDNYRQMNNDCRQGLAFALGWLGEKPRFIFLDNKNSHDFGGPAADITSYITGYLRL
jgi:AmmeMemoRadiSam system protein B